eukprot:augustus_masked-scaffold_2-processed-gene-20.42-mRNA-1 protein AED:0.31 eAED:0.31 QI:0/-1/0/1/-1/1/1/0/357
MLKHLKHLENALLVKTNNGQIKEFQMKKNIVNYTLRTIGEVGFGHEFRSDEEVFDFSKTWENFFHLMVQSLLNPLWNKKHAKYFIPSKINFLRQKEKIDKILYEIIDKNMLQDQAARSTKGDMLSLFMNAAEGTEFFTRTMLRDFSIIFLAGGADTSLHTLSYLFYVLSKDQNLQVKLRAEILKFSKYDAKTTDFDINLDAMKECKLLDGVLFEVLRLYGPVTFNGRKCVKDDILPDGTFVEKNTTILYDHYAMGRDPTRYENPLEIIPERWMSDDRETETFSSFELPAFGAGNRICIGRHLAMQEVKMFVCFILTKYEFELSEKEKQVLKTQEALYGVNEFHNYQADLLLDLKERF